MERRTPARTTFSRRRLMATVGAGVACAALAAVVRPVVAQGRYPTRPVRLVVPFPAGTSPDVVARLWAERFAKSTGQAVVA